MAKFSLKPLEFQKCIKCCDLLISQHWFSLSLLQSTSDQIYFFTVKSNNAKIIQQ